VVCVAIGETLCQARVMARSLQRHHPDWDLEVVVVGSTVLEPAEETFALVPVETVLGTESEDLLARHSPEELTMMLVPRMLEARCRSAGELVVHLPASA
jgi:hypothetical protein